jgi:hypothetical protein
MESNAKNLGHLSIEILPGDLITLGNAIQILVTEKKGGRLKLKVIAPKVVLVNYKPRRTAQ